MKKKWTIVLIIMSVIFFPLILSASVSASLPYGYIITDLGDLYGGESMANGINNNGIVVGWSNVPDMSDNARAFLWTKENGMVELNGLYPESSSIAGSINDLGEIAGNGTNISDQIWGWHGIFWTMDHQVIDLGKNPHDPTQSNFAHDINVHGQVVGECVPAGWIWTESDGYQFLPGDATYGMAINDEGEVVGRTNTFSPCSCAYIWSEQLGLINLGALDGDWSQANDINNNRWVVGYYDLPNGGSHAFFWTEETGMIDIGTLGGNSSYAHAINDLGQVIGRSDSEYSSAAFIWTVEDGMIDLNDFLPADSEWYLLGAADINNLGQIVGEAWKGGHWYWDPDPEMQTWIRVGGEKRAFLLTTVSQVLEIEIDIKPGSYPNSINLKSKGKVPVAILTTDDFDAHDVDPVTCEFAGAYPLRWKMEDVDYDGDYDMLFHFMTQQLELTNEITEATLEGETIDGVQITGTDSVNIVPKCKGHDKKGKKYAKKSKKFKMKGKKGK